MLTAVHEHKAGKCMSEITKGAATRSARSLLYQVTGISLEMDQLVLRFLVPCGQVRPFRVHVLVSQEIDG